MPGSAGSAPKTYNDILKLLRSAFEQLREDGQNPFKKIPTQESETIFRKPYTEEELYSLREATHLTSFGLEPGDKEASALADKLISEMVNKKFAALQIKLPATSEILSNDPKCLFGIFKHPTLKYYKRKQIGNKTYFEPVGNPFTSSYGPLLNLPPCGFSYRFSSVIKKFEGIFVGKQELDNLDLDPQFKEVWEANKNEPLEKSKNDAENIFEKLEN